MGRASTRLFVLWAVSWTVALAGFFFARAWYADDGCTIAHWKCTVGADGLTAFIWGGLLGLVMLIGAVVALVGEGTRARRASHGDRP